MSKDMEKVLRKINKLIIILSILICGLYAVMYYVHHDYLMVTASIIAIGLPFLIYLVDAKVKKTSLPIKTFYLLFIYASAVIGGVGEFYSLFNPYDKIVHFISGVLITWVFLVLVQPYVKKYTTNLILFTVICFNSMIALLWEVGEFTFDLIFKTSVQRGLYDTMTDMIVAVVGGLIIALIYALKKHQL
ncbi:MAG: DUF2238 domain-containing protein [Bacilli bacterium]|nr:DUF2238 domain-containing protein [Bacilli bacterium]MDD3304558.1 DUF2238 domain-containing protein [Bacilli bacterium]MDD4053826.1 DUF2238 domain-containing protein [Bacilli bacterium]